MQCAGRELNMFRPVVAGFYHRLRIAGSIGVLAHGGSLLADQPSGRGGGAYRAGSTGGAPSRLQPSITTDLADTDRKLRRRTISRHSAVGCWNGRQTTRIAAGQSPLRPARMWVFSALLPPPNEYTLRGMHSDTGAPVRWDAIANLNK